MSVGHASVCVTVCVLAVDVLEYVSYLHVDGCQVVFGGRPEKYISRIGEEDYSSIGSC